MDNKLSTNHYKIPNLSVEWLEKNSFRFCKGMSNSEDGRIYKYNFPCYRYYDMVSLFCEIMVNFDTNDAIVDVVDNNRARYAPFYGYIYGDYAPLLNEINGNIERQIKKLGLILKDENDYGGEQRRVFDMPVRKGRRNKSGKNKGNVRSEE